MTTVRVAAWQSPIEVTDTPEVLDLLAAQLDSCAREGASILCCPECVLGGLGDFHPNPRDLSLSVESGELAATLAVTGIGETALVAGFTEWNDDVLFNSAAVMQHGRLIGVYRKQRPAIRKSVYAPGTECPVFTVNGVTFGILICYDSTFEQYAATLVEQGAQMILIPSNNGLPHGRDDVQLLTRQCDAAIARNFNIPVIRADVAGRTSQLVSPGSSGITTPSAGLVASVESFSTGLIIAEVVVR